MCPEQLQGIWQCVSRQPSNSDETDPKDTLIWIQGNKASFVARGEKTIEASFSVDVNTAPMRITWTFESDDAGASMDKLTEIFKIDDDTLTTCRSDVGKPIPTKFEVSKGGDLGMSVYRKKQRLATVGTVRTIHISR